MNGLHQFEGVNLITASLSLCIKESASVQKFSLERRERGILGDHRPSFMIVQSEVAGESLLGQTKSHSFAVITSSDPVKPQRAGASHTNWSIFSIRAAVFGS